jgi:hypothetical protein
MKMHQLIYMSRPFGFDATDLRNILAISRDRNARDDITGALICRSDIYLQLLEGPVGKVEATFERICEDDRHVEVHVLVRGATEDRLFQKWAMKHDPAPSWLWSPDEVHAGLPQQASPRDLRAIFLRSAQDTGQ